VKKYLHRASERNRNLQQTFREKFKGCRQTENTKEQMDSPLKSSQVERRVERERN